MPAAVTRRKPPPPLPFERQRGSFWLVRRNRARSRASASKAATGRAGSVLRRERSRRIIWRCVTTRCRIWSAGFLKTRRHGARDGRVYQPAKEAKHHAPDTKQTFMANAHGLCRQSLYALRSRVGAHGERGRQTDALPGRPRTAAARFNGLQQVSGERARGLASRTGGAAADAISAEFAAKLEGLRRRLPRWEIPAAIRALQAEKHMALRALRDQKQGERFAAREITRRAQTGFPPTARPS